MLKRRSACERRRSFVSNSSHVTVDSFVEKHEVSRISLSGVYLYIAVAHHRTCKVTSELALVASLVAIYMLCIL